MVSPCLQGHKVSATVSWLLAEDTRDSWVRDRGLLRQHELPVHIASPIPPTPKGRCRAAQVTAAPRLGLERSWKPSSSTIVSFLDYVCLLASLPFFQRGCEPACPSFAPEGDIVFIIPGKRANLLSAPGRDCLCLPRVFVDASGL